MRHRTEKLKEDFRFKRSLQTAILKHEGDHTEGVRYCHLPNWNFSASLDGENERWGRYKTKELKTVGNMMKGRMQSWGGRGTLTMC